MPLHQSADNGLVTLPGIRRRRLQLAAIPKLLELVVKGRSSGFPSATPASRIRSEMRVAPRPLVGVKTKRSTAPLHSGSGAVGEYPGGSYYRMGALEARWFREVCFDSGLEGRHQSNDRGANC